MFVLSFFFCLLEIINQMIITVNRGGDLREFVGKWRNFVCKACFIFAAINF
jgi:hypothetical protein